MTNLHHVVDLFVLGFLAFYLYEQLKFGARYALFNLISMLLATFLSLFLYNFLSQWMADILLLPQGIAGAIVFFFLTLALWSLFIIVLIQLSRKVFKFSFTKKVNLVLSVIFGLLSSGLLISFFLTLFLSFPTAQVVKDAIRNSLSGQIVLPRAQVAEILVKRVFGGAIEETLNFLTVKPHSDSRVFLRFMPSQRTIDFSSEQEMLRLINQERQQAGLRRVVWSEALAEAARAHGLDMAQNAYFGHVSLDGRGPSDRLLEYNIAFQVTGENLALAPDTTIAMQGLMNSPGHRENILASDFAQVGVGVIDIGIYGKIFVQEFID